MKSQTTAFILMLSVNVCFAFPHSPQGLKCNYRMNPLGIDDAAPHLSWLVNDNRPGAMQSAYRVQAALSVSDLASEERLIWDSHKIQSHQSTQISYAGHELKSQQRVYWRVRTWDAEDIASPWSETAWFETALLKQTDWGEAKWIGGILELESSQFAPPDVMGDWISAPENFEVQQFATEVDLPDKPIVSAMGYWDTNPNDLSTHSAAITVNPGIGQKSTYHVELNRLLAWSTHGYGDYAFYLEPGRKNRIELELKKPEKGIVATIGMRIVFADGEEMIVSSGDDWQAWTSKYGSSAAVQKRAAYGPDGLGEAVIFHPKPQPPVWLRRKVNIKPGLENARLYMSGLGYARSYVNGTQVDDHLMTPAQSDYESYAYYTTQNITTLLKPGANALAVHLSSGWFHQIGGFGSSSYGHPGMKALLVLEYQNGQTERITSDKNWLWKTGALTSANVYAGERVDYRKYHEEWKRPEIGTSWEKVQVLMPLTPKLVALDVLPVRPTKTIQPKRKWKTGSQTWVYDMGEVLLGMIRFGFDEDSGKTIRIRYTEIANRNNTLENAPASQWWCHGLTQGDVLISDGTPHTYQSEFCTKSFRYVEISGTTKEPQNIEAFIVRTDAESLMEFASSNKMLNRLYENGIRTHRNYVSHMLADRPRERCLWGAESSYSWVTAFNGFDWALNHKLMADLWLTGRMAPGNIPSSIGVGKRITSDPPHDFNWSVTALPLIYRIYTHYGDLRDADKHYEMLKHILDYFEQTSKGGLLIATPGYGDHAAPSDIKRREQDKQLIQSFGYYEAQKMFAVLAERLGENADAAHARMMAKKIRKVLLTFYDPDSHTFGNGTHDSLALLLGILEDDQEKKLLGASLAGYYENNGYKFDGGFMSYNIYPELSRAGYANVAFKMLINDSYPGAAWSVTRNDATTYWEAYYEDFITQCQRGLNFFAFAHPTGWMLTDLAGIRLDPNMPGGQRLILEPHIPVGEDLDWINCNLKTAHGLVQSNWKIEVDSLIWSFSIPPNTTAEVVFPATIHRDKMNGSGSFLRNKEHRSVYEMNAGKYRFKMPLPPPSPAGTKPSDQFNPDLNSREELLKTLQKI